MPRYPSASPLIPAPINKARIGHWRTVNDHPLTPRTTTFQLT